MAAINKVQEQSLLYATFPLIFHTEPRLRLDLECILMKDFLLVILRGRKSGWNQTPKELNPLH